VTCREHLHETQVIPSRRHFVKFPSWREDFVTLRFGNPADSVKSKATSTPYYSAYLHQFRIGKSAGGSDGGMK
jgi:hypothetical protein